ncbi:hypothetical protein LSH36_222g03044, partial [Paralvinella palmiformis]
MVHHRLELVTESPSEVTPPTVSADLLEGLHFSPNPEPFPHRLAQYDFCRTIPCSVALVAAFLVMARASLIFLPTVHVLLVCASVLDLKAETAATEGAVSGTLLTQESSVISDALCLDAVHLRPQ